MDLSNLRQDYELGELSKEQLRPDPFKQFEEWLKQAISTNDNLIEPYAMMLATSSKQGKPFVRTVILRSFDKKGFVFYTNYLSPKAQQISENPYVAMCFYWYWLERQVRIEGKAKKVPREMSETYFHSRPYDNQISAWVSEQSAVVDSREALEAKFASLKQQYPNKVPLPDFWGGYCVEPENFEFWQGRPGRLHDRFLYGKQGQKWNIVRLCP